MNTTLTDEGYTLDGKWRLVPSEYMESLTLPNPPAELSISSKPVAMVDAGDDGYFAEILPDVSVSVGDQLYAFPPLNVDPVLWKAAFDQWWEAHGQYLRAGGGQYEKTFGYHAWEAAAALYATPSPPQSLSSIPPDCRACANRGRVNGLSQESYCESCIWQGMIFRQNHFVDASKMVDIAKRRCEACAILPCSCK